MHRFQKIRERRLAMVKAVLVHTEVVTHVGVEMSVK